MFLHSISYIATHPLWLYSFYIIRHVHALSYTYSVEPGDSVSFVDESYTNRFASGVWYFNMTTFNPCESHIQQNIQLHMLCIIYYQVNFTLPIDLPECYRPYFNYTCNETSLHMYNISANAPTTYWLKKFGGQENETFYYLNITLKIPTILTTQLEYSPPPPLDSFIFYNPVIQ